MKHALAAVLCIAMPIAMFASENGHKLTRRRLSSFYENRRTCPQVFLRRCGQASIRARGT